VKSGASKKQSKQSKSLEGKRLALEEIERRRVEKQLALGRDLPKLDFLKLRAREDELRVLIHAAVLLRREICTAEEKLKSKTLRG